MSDEQLRAYKRTRDASDPKIQTSIGLTKSTAELLDHLAEGSTMSRSAVVEAPVWWGACKLGLITWPSSVPRRARQGVMQLASLKED